jgi:hypothetical protein
MGFVFCSFFLFYTLITWVLSPIYSVEFHLFPKFYNLSFLNLSKNFCLTVFKANFHSGHFRKESPLTQENNFSFYFDKH